MGVVVGVVVVVVMVRRYPPTKRALHATLVGAVVTPDRGGYKQNTIIPSIRIYLDRLDTGGEYRA